MDPDYWSGAATNGYDYVIGGMYYLRRGSEFRSVDGTPDILLSTVDDCFSGDWSAMAEECYRLVGNLYEKTRRCVAVHLDMIEKFKRRSSAEKRQTSGALFW